MVSRFVWSIGGKTASGGSDILVLMIQTSQALRFDVDLKNSGSCVKAENKSAGGSEICELRR